MNTPDLIVKSSSPCTVVDHQVLIHGTNDHRHNQNSTRRILVIGCGSIGRCSLPLLHELLIGDLKPQSITVLDCVTPLPATLAWLKSVNIGFEQRCIEEDSYGDLLSNYLSAGDLLLDLVFNVSTAALVRWCHENEVLYVNATVDAWFLTAKGGNLFNTHYFELFKWHSELLEMQDQLRQQYGKKAPTAIVEHGANPGLVSHFVKRGLQDMASHVLHNRMIIDLIRRQNIQDALDKKDHARLAHLLGVKVIQISERDSQATNIPRQRNEIVNTWSTVSICEESTCYVQFAWGTHERQTPEAALFNDQSAQKWPPLRICLPYKGLNVWVSLLI
jgi:homospermidine synthase